MRSQRGFFSIFSIFIISFLFAACTINKEVQEPDSQSKLKVEEVIPSVPIRPPSVPKYLPLIMPPLSIPLPPPPPPLPPRRPIPQFLDIFFDKGSSLIKSNPDSLSIFDPHWTMKERMDKNVDLLKNLNPLGTLGTLVIEGHCDQRGKSLYNLRLGKRRAEAVRDYLVKAGIDWSRLKIISYGTERPFVLGHDEIAWRWNRRVHFVIESYEYRY